VKTSVMVFALALSCVFFLEPSFADEYEDLSQAVTAQYQEAAGNLQNELGDYPADSVSVEEFYAEQERNLAQTASELETAHQAGHISDADYEEAKKSLAETQEFILTRGDSLSPQMAALGQAAAPILAAHDACQDLDEDPQGYQTCVQSKLQ
jgi:hypothetical protein